MNRQLPLQYHRDYGVPRTRGDEPESRLPTPGGILLGVPRTRGDEPNAVADWAGILRGRVPRTRGDEPSIVSIRMFEEHLACSPHTRG